ncbi:MAG: hypothetical protein K2Q13_09995 [Nitrosomonas sp.]|uniref:hypothetical protein n=1 Tax=Nitrosomonas sp. TaxID=42353 RepID=UPI0025DD6EB2|nr:hypothetical protein [Nitrosomonas sp.]MBY0475372.1 hypothetical protein [Nitrosomonas sp.]
MDFPNAKLPNLTPLKNSFVADDIENDLRNLFIDLFEEMIAGTAFDANVLGNGQLGSMDLIRKLVNVDGLALIDGAREETATRYLYKAWKSRNKNGRGFHFLKTYLQLLFPNAFVVEQMAQAKAEDYPTDLMPLARSDNTRFSTSRVRVSIDASKTTWENVIKMDPILRSIIPARLVLYFALLTTWRKTNYIGAAMLGGTISTVYPAASQPSEHSWQLNTGAAMVSVSINVIYPKP